MTRTRVAPFAEPTDPLTGPCARCRKVYADHPGGFCPDGIGADGYVNVMDAPIYVPADEAAATEGFAEFSARRDAERAAADADYISVRKAILPGSRPGESGFVARSGDVRAFARPVKGGYEYGAFDGTGKTVKLHVKGRTVTLSGAKEAAVAIVRETKKEVAMATATSGEKAAPAKKAATVDTADLRTALVAAIEEAVPGATRKWNKTGRYETFYLDGTRAFGLVFKEGARTVSVKIPGQLREIKVSDASGFTKSEYGLTRSVSKRGEIRSVAKVFATAADAVAKKAEAATAPAATEES